MGDDRRTERSIEGRWCGVIHGGGNGGVWRVLRREGWRVEGEDEWNCGENKIRNLHYYYL